MNRLLVLTIAAALSQFALACHTDRTEIYEPAPAGQTQDEAAEQIDTAKVSDSPDLNFPVPAQADAPIDLVAVKVIDDGVNLINGGVVKPETIMPPVYDPTRLEQINGDGTIQQGPVDIIDTNEITTLPGLNVNPLLIIDAPPSRQDAQTQPDGLPPF